MRELGQALLQQVANIGLIGTGGARDDHLGRNDVGRADVAAGDMADADHRGFDRLDVAADDGL